MRVLSPLAAILFAAIPVSAQEPPPRCDAPEHRQFDFWVGEWTVTNARGEVAGENTITSIHDGCALREEWRSARGGSGSSLNFYDRSTPRWHQTWIAVGGQPLFMDGGLDAEGRMALTTAPSLEGKFDRITWTPNADGSVRQLWDRTEDGGETWTVVFDGTYRKK